jgi:hypothetical protein
MSRYGNSGGYGGGYSGGRGKLGAWGLLQTVVQHLDPSDPPAFLVAITMLLGAGSAIIWLIWGIQGQTTCWRFNPGAPEDYGSNAGCLIRSVTNVFRPGNFEPSSRRPYADGQQPTPTPQQPAGIAVPPGGVTQP